MELFDLPDAPRPDEDVPAPPRFLPECDNVFIGHKDRSRIAGDQASRATWLANVDYPVFLLDGFIQGTWTLKTDRKRSRATLTIKPFETLPKTCRGPLKRRPGRSWPFTRRTPTTTSGGACTATDRRTAAERRSPRVSGVSPSA